MFNKILDERVLLARAGQNRIIPVGQLFYALILIQEKEERMMNETRKGKHGRKRVWKVIFSVLLIGMVGTVAYLFKAYSDIGSTAESIYTSVNVNEMREEEIEVETATQPQGHGNVVGGVGAFHLREEPQALLGERQRQRAVTRYRHDLWLRTASGLAQH